MEYFYKTLMKNDWFGHETNVEKKVIWKTDQRWYCYELILWVAIGNLIIIGHNINNANIYPKNGQT